MYITATGFSFDYNEYRTHVYNRHVFLPQDVSMMRDAASRLDSTLLCKVSMYICLHSFYLVLKNFSPHIVK